jgi:hypothetical protein
LTRYNFFLGDRLINHETKDTVKEESRKVTVKMKHVTEYQDGEEKKTIEEVIAPTLCSDVYENNGVFQHS